MQAATSGPTKAQKALPMSGCFAIFPDQSPDDGNATPLALFEYLDEAIAWGSKRYAGGAFRIRFVPYDAVADLMVSRRQAS
jgi:hypothetical protein